MKCSFVLLLVFSFFLVSEDKNKSSEPERSNETSSNSNSSIRSIIQDELQPSTSTANEEGDNSDSDNTEAESHAPRAKKMSNLSERMKIKLQAQFKWLGPKKNDFFCIVCSCHIAGTKYHIERHANVNSHKNKLAAAKKTPKIVDMYKNPIDAKKMFLIKEAELKYCAFLAEHNLPFLLMDSLPEFCRNIYPDSEIVKSVKIKRKKATQLIVSVIAPFLQQEIADILKKILFLNS